MKRTAGTRERQGFFVFLNLYRWINWVLAVGLLYLGATPEASPAITIITYGSVFLYNGFFTLWPRRVETFLRSHPSFMLVDSLFCISLLFAYGWGSPFYVYSFSPIMLAGYLFRLRGSFVVAGLGAIGYLTSVATTGMVWADIAELGEVDTHLFQGFDYFLIAIFFSYPAVLLDRLQRANDELRQTRQKVERLVLAEERRRMAADIHDNVTQSLLGVSTLIDDSLRKNQGDPKIDRQLVLAKEAAGRAMDEMREAVDDLFNERLERLTVTEIIEQMLDKAGETHDLVTKLSVSGHEPDLTMAPKKALYLAVQEVVSNVIKHSGAGSVAVDLSFAPDALIVEVVDDGRGFDSDHVCPGNGLQTIARRLTEAGATHKMTSGPGSGTRVEIRLPLGPALQEVLLGG